MSEIRANTVSNAAGTGPVTLTGQYAAKAWVSFKGDGTVSIYGSGNVSSITDNGTGYYTVNFSSSLTDGNYAVTAAGQYSSAGVNYHSPIIGMTADNYGSPSTSSFRVAASTGSEAVIDPRRIMLSVDR